MKTERFSKLPYPIHKNTSLSPADLFEELPGLRRYFNSIPKGIKDLDDLPEGRRSTPLDIVKIIKYIVFLYDPETDLTYEYSDDIRLRKEAAAREAGFKRESNGDWPQHVADILDFKNEAVVDWIIDFLKVRKNTIWTEIKFIEEELDSLNRSRAESIRIGNIKSDIMNLTRERQDELYVLYKKFYADHTDLKAKTEDRLFPVTPENVFKELKVGKEIYQMRQIKDVLSPSKTH